MPSRRGVLKLIGGGTVLAAASVGGFIYTSQPSSKARQPWRVAGLYDDFRKRALSFALLAPNPHNRQPWLVKLKGDNALTLYCDLERRLPATDPYDRQITIGCGAFLDLLSMAAAEEGYSTDIQLFPDGEDMATLDKRPIAHVTFTPQSATPDLLFRQILNRRTNREAYAPTPVPAEALAALKSATAVFGVDAEMIGDTNEADWLRDLTWRAHEAEMKAPAPHQESVDLMRIGPKEVAANPDGIVMEGAMISTGKLLGILNRETLADPNSTAFQQGLDMFKERAYSARAFGWLVNEDNNRSDQINAGRAYVRFNLKATELGLAIHPWSQALQEYPEMAQIYEELHARIGKGRRVQMLARIGYAKPVIQAPRRGLNAHIVSL